MGACPVPCLFSEKGSGAFVRKQPPSETGQQDQEELGMSAQGQKSSDVLLSQHSEYL